MKSNDATRATAEAMPEINRRRFLLNTAAAGAVAAAVAAPVVVEAMEPENPWFKVRRLARELSDALADVDDGNVYAEIFPPGRQFSICFGDIDAFEERQKPYERAADVVDMWAIEPAVQS